MTLHGSQNEILAAEERRRQALLDGDITTLDHLLSSDLLHVHTNGLVENKVEYLAGLSEHLRFLRVDRKSIVVKLRQDVAIVTGVIDQVVRLVASGDDIRLDTFATIVWVRDDGWRVSSYQATRIV